MFKLPFDVDHLVFDMDDTLCATGVYIRTMLTRKFLSINREDLLLEMENHLKKEGGLTASKEIREFTYHEVISKDKYMLEAQPTMLFYHFFICHDYLPKNVKVHICTHRGFSENGKKYTEQWINRLSRRPIVTDIHCLKSGTHANKLDYLKSVYGERFLLIDDNPVYGLDKVHEPLSNTLVYDTYGRYDAYKKQKRLVFLNGEYVVI